MIFVVQYVPELAGESVGTHVFDVVDSFAVVGARGYRERMPLQEADRGHLLGVVFT